MSESQSVIRAETRTRPAGAFLDPAVGNAGTPLNNGHSARRRSFECGRPFPLAAGWLTG